MPVAHQSLSTLCMLFPSGVTDLPKLTKFDLLIFIKHYDPHTETLRLVGRLILPKSARVCGFLTTLWVVLCRCSHMLCDIPLDFSIRFSFGFTVCLNINVLVTKSYNCCKIALKCGNIPGAKTATHALSVSGDFVTLLEMMKGNPDQWQCVRFKMQTMTGWIDSTLVPLRPYMQHFLSLFL